MGDEAGAKNQGRFWNNLKGIVPALGWNRQCPPERRQPGLHQIPWLSVVSLPQAVLVTETYLEVKRNADHKVSENRQEGADQVFL